MLRKLKLIGMAVAFWLTATASLTGVMFLVEGVLLEDFVVGFMAVPIFGFLTYAIGQNMWSLYVRGN